MKIDTLGDFNEIIEYYKCMLDLADKIKPNMQLQYTMTPEKLLTHTYFMAQLRAQVNNIGVSVAQNYEKINEKNGEYRVKEEYIESACKRKEYFYNLMKENNMSPYEVIKQIRNCLVHGEYDIELENISNIELLDDEPAIKGPFDIFIVLNNGKIQVKLDALEIRELEYIYSDLNTFYSNRTETFIMTGDGKFASCKNKYFLGRYLDSIRKLIVRGKKVKDESGDNIDWIISKLVRSGMLRANETEKIKRVLENIKEHSNSNYFEVFHQ